MSEEEKEARTFNEDQQEMFGTSEANQAGVPVRPRTPGTAAAPLPDAGFEPIKPHADEAREPEPRLHVVPARAEGGPEITGGTDKYGPGGLADKEQHAHTNTGVRETGDISGASSTHAGAGGQMGETGGTGTAPDTANRADSD
jgi:hypothetical protein